MDADKVFFTIKVRVPNGPTMEIANTISFSHQGNSSVVIAAGAHDYEVPLPWSTDLLAKFMVITPAKASPLLTYKVNEAGSTETVTSTAPATSTETAAGTEESGIFALDGPHVLIGQGAVRLLGDRPARLFFSNSSNEPIAVEILIGGSNPAP